MQGLQYKSCQHNPQALSVAFSDRTSATWSNGLAGDGEQGQASFNASHAFCVVTSEIGTILSHGRFSIPPGILFFE